MINLPTHYTQAFFILVLSVIKIPAAAGGILPVNGSQLTTTHVMFELEDIYGADYYTLDIYRKEKNEVDVKGQPVFSSKTVHLAVLAKKGLQFGNNYTWQFHAYKKEKPIYTSPWYHFSILTSPRIDTSFYRQQVIAHHQTGDDFLLIDRTAMAIDRQGDPVWFLPAENDSLDQLLIRDLALTPAGTITHLDKNGAYDKTLDGVVLWKGPDDGSVSGTSKEQYHHQLLKLDDGSFVVCGIVYKPDQQATSSPVPYSTIIHYNIDGTIRWKWNELNSMEKDPLFKDNRNNTSGGHLNGFAFTPDKNRLLLSFKNLCDVYVLNYNTGLFETSIKKSRPAGNAGFYQQHGPVFNIKNEVFIYNNNIKEGFGKEDTGTIHPSAIIFRYDIVKRKFTLLTDQIIRSAKYPEGIVGKEGYNSETKTGNMLICAGGANYTVEMTRKGQKIWECYFYRRTVTDTTWKPYSNYRCRSIASLYPLFYTLQYVQNKNGLYLFKLHNAGSTATSFRLQFSDKEGRASPYYLSSLLPPGGSQIFSIPAKWTRQKDFDCKISTMSVKSEIKIYHYKIGSLQ